jgi:4'-phosphopantetheinyl transferase
VILSPDYLDVWHLIPSTASVGWYSRTVTAAEHERAGRFRREDALRFLASRALARAALASQLGSGPLEIGFTRRCPHCGDPDHGRPVAISHDRTAEFSLTRAGEVVAVVIASDPVGLDAEPRRAGTRDLLATQVFSDEDRTALSHGGPSSSPDRILALWVAKEAVGKLSGLGLLNAGRIRTVPSHPGWAPALDALGRSCWQSAVEMPTVAAAAVATYTGPATIRTHDGATFRLGGRD